MFCSWTSSLLKEREWGEETNYQGRIINCLAPLIPVPAPDMYSEYIDNLKFSLGKWMEPALVWEKSTIYTFILTEKLASKVFFLSFLNRLAAAAHLTFFWELYVSAQQGARRACQPPSWPRYGCASCRRSSRPCPSIETWNLTTGDFLYLFPFQTTSAE